MGPGNRHYERAFEAYLRLRRMPYVLVDEARRALTPLSGPLRIEGEDATLKSFDCVVYGPQRNVLVDIKGRKIPQPKEGSTSKRKGRLECWVTRDDIESLTRWQSLFGPGFDAAFVFVYWCDRQPPDALFQEVFEHAGCWYALRAVRLSDYRAAMKVRSPRWGTVDLPGAAFESLSQPFAPAWLASA